MADEPASRSRKLAKPAIAGLILIFGLVVGVYFRSELWQGIKWTGSWLSDWLTEWAPEHKGQALTIIVFIVVSLIINYVAHRKGRLGAWIFALVVEGGLWLLFWYGLFIPSFNDLVGLDLDRMPLGTTVLSGLVVIGITGVVFWILELREIWKGKS